MCTAKKYLHTSNKNRNIRIVYPLNTILIFRMHAICFNYSLYYSRPIGKNYRLGILNFRPLLHKICRIFFSLSFILHSKKGHFTNCVKRKNMNEQEV